MKKTLTDAQVAKALGYQFSLKWRRWLDSKMQIAFKDLPAFTTSLDAIVAEIEARGLDFKEAVIEWMKDHSMPHEMWNPKILCEATIAYLKERP